MDDLISRQAAIDYFVTNVGFHDEDGYPIEDTDELRKIWTEYFSGIPSAQPKRIKGHWVEIASSNHTYKCSVCGRLLVNITDGKNNVAKNYPYCHCGADMRGEQVPELRRKDG